VALTFDDDLQSHVAYTLPLLRRLRAPAAFFLSGASLDRPWRFWWEDLQVALRTGALAGGLPGVGQDLVASALAGATKAPKQLAAAIEELPAIQRAEVGLALRSIAREVPTHVGIGADQVRRLAESGYEVGFHTLRHDRLPALPDAELRAALVDGRAELEHATGRALTAISYPHGRADRRVADAARAAGFEWGFMGHGRAVTADDDPLLLPRIDPAATSVGAFALEIARFTARKI
jgi:peptidoglycan/xylan/chitin deacetylase (PgdA/CDA1 family)